MSRLALFAALMLMSAGPAAAQVGREQFVQADTAYDAVHAVQRDAFLFLRDSTLAIEAALAKFMGGLGPSSSLPWMQTRARSVAAACARSELPLANAKAVTEQWLPATSGQKDAHTKLLEAIPAFANELRGCQERWTALAADTSQVSLRERAPYQMKQLQAKLDAFNRTAQTYLRSISVKLPPSGTKPS